MLTRAVAIAALILVSAPALAGDACAPDDDGPFLQSTVGLLVPNDPLAGAEFELWGSGYWRGRQGLHGCAKPTEMQALQELLDAVQEPLTVPNPAVCRAKPQFPVVVSGPGWKATWTVPCPAVIPSDELAAVVDWMSARRLTAEFERARARPIDEGPCEGGQVGGPPSQRVVYLHPHARPPVPPAVQARDRPAAVWSWMQAHRGFAVLAIPGPNPLAKVDVTLELASGERITQSTHNVVRQGGPGPSVTPPLKLTLTGVTVRKIADSRVVAIHQLTGPAGTAPTTFVLTRPERTHLDSAMACAVSRLP
ncbi:MAG: hypothetical protein AB8H79_08530 [Myxococcota bacterium]